MPRTQRHVNRDLERLIAGALRHSRRLGSIRQGGSTIGGVYNLGDDLDIGVESESEIQSDLGLSECSEVPAEPLPGADFGGRLPWEPSFDMDALTRQGSESGRSTSMASEQETEGGRWVLEDSYEGSQPLAACKRSELFMTVALWAATSSVTTSDWSALCEILQPLRLGLPAAKKTLTVSLAAELPTLEILVQQSKVDASRVHPQGLAEKPIYYFDLASVIVRSVLDIPRLKEKLYFGPALRQSNGGRSELWHGDAWAESIRATSGDLPRYPREQYLAIFPSDFIEYCSQDTPKLARVARIWKAGSEFQLEVQAVTQSPTTGKYILIESPTALLTPGCILRRLKFTYLNCSGDLSDKQVEFGVIESVHSDRNLPRTPDRRHQILAEGELQFYGRDYMQKHFVYRGGAKILCVPILLFCDGFALYRTIYKSCMGYYICPANLPLEERRLQTNWHTLALGPFGATFSAVVDCLGVAGRKLAEGLLLKVRLYPNPLKLTSFLLAGIGDMPQQAQSLGIKSQNSLTPCQRCFIPREEMSNLQYDCATNYR